MKGDLKYYVLLVIVFAGLVYFPWRFIKQDAESLQKNGKVIIGKIVQFGKGNTVYWEYSDAGFSGRVAEDIYFEGLVRGEEYLGIYDPTDPIIGELDLLRPYLENKKLDTLFNIKLLNETLESSTRSLIYRYQVDGKSYQRKLLLFGAKNVEFWLNNKDWMVVYIVGSPEMGYLFPNTMIRNEDK